MAATNELGIKAEELAVLHLLGEGFEILERNWIFRSAEIDIIASKDGKLHFVEVKGRRFYPGSFPEQNVTKKKFRLMLRAAEEYLHKHPEFKSIEFGIISVTFYKSGETKCFFIRDVFL